MRTGGEAPAVHAGRTVLVVDEEPLVLKAIGRLLVASGYGVALAANAVEAWRAAERGGLELVIMDARLRGVTAVECLLGLRARGIRVPVISISGLPEPPQAFDVLPVDARPRLHVTKPATRAQLLSAVQVAIDAAPMVCERA